MIATLLRYLYFDNDLFRISAHHQQRNSSIVKEAIARSSKDF